MRTFAKSILPLLTIAFSGSAILSGYVFAGLSPPTKVQDFLASFYWFTVLVWIRCDAKKRRKIPCFDFGLFLLVLAPFSILWYLVCSRGFVKGLLVALSLLVLGSLSDIMLQVVSNGSHDGLAVP